MTTNLSYPIGQPSTETIQEENMAVWKQDIRDLPQKLTEAVSGLSAEQLDTPYRPEGWTIRQVVHHLADSHMNSFTRFKLALTEANPTIKPYEEHLWAEQPDTIEAPIELSLHILEGLHARWFILLNSLNAEDWQKTFYHPGSGQTMSLAEALRMYSWHSRHHTAHIVNLRHLRGW
ncbi:putative metal-dependent hydrolase [Paenibacillus sp. JX-17]|uniref:Metal-dependent hydrolase n=1 Tax=Paenibacillus lacisoli TaxID=3064525 RepID=A0ABT9CH82_9BACL|nr:putative metal-dependent hydrolase [Paenibacillus sp. JX-17]MDO7908004.1 putative metal-dependent hydrolase [Paenibacillus sp. JX-17]